MTMRAWVRIGIFFLVIAAICCVFCIALMIHLIGEHRTGGAVALGVMAIFMAYQVGLISMTLWRFWLRGDQ